MKKETKEKIELILIQIFVFTLLALAPIWFILIWVELITENETIGRINNWIFLSYIIIAFFCLIMMQFDGNGRRKGED